MIYKNNAYNSGDIIIGSIKGISLKGKIFIGDERFWFCHNDSNLNGYESPDTLGYDYSWVFRIYNDELSDEVEIFSNITNTSGPKLGYNIESELLFFMQSQGLSNEVSYLELNVIYPSYNLIRVSDTKGMVKLINSDTNRFVEIKIGRFLKSLFKQIKPVSNLEIKTTDKELESISNNFLLFSNNEHIKIELLSGNSILDAYKTENYLSIKSTLGSSCMNDKDSSYFDIYTDNPEIVSMLIIKTYGKIAGRCLIWTTECGKKVMDKRYTSDDWVNVKFDEIRNTDGYLNYDSIPESSIKLTVNLKDVISENYPYLDTFRYLNIENNVLCNMYTKDESNKKIILLTRTDGEYNTLR
jgi:hypothetical protein